MSRYYRGGVEAQELHQKKTKENKSETVRKHYCRHFRDIRNEFYLNVFSMDRCQLLWLLRSGKVVGYKVEILILDPWILKEGEILENEVTIANCRGN